MKILPKIYAQAIVDALKKKNAEEIAPKIWYLLVKNGQLRNLNIILDDAEKLIAQDEGKVLVKLFSNKALSPEEIKEVSEKIGKYNPQKNLEIKNIIDEKITGLFIIADDKIIDMSIGGKINKLKQILTSSK